MFVRFFANNDQSVRVEFSAPIPLALANMIRKVLYIHAPVWAFDIVEVKNNPSHHSLPSELLEEKLKHIILQCAKPAHINTMRMHALKASLRPIPSSAKSIKGSDIIFKGTTHAYAAANAAVEFGLSVWPHAVDIAHVFPTTFATPGSTSKPTGFDVSFDAHFASAFDMNDASNRYAVSNVRFAFSPNDPNTVVELTYEGRGHYASPDILFMWGMHRLHEHLQAIEVAFVAQLTT